MNQTFYNIKLHPMVRVLETTQSVLELALRTPKGCISFNPLNKFNYVKFTTPFRLVRDYR